MFLVKKCAICKQRFNSITNRNYAKLYSDALRVNGAEAVKRLLEAGAPRSPADDGAFVCKQCALKVATMECAVCKKSFNVVADGNHVTLYNAGILTMSDPETEKCRQNADISYHQVGDGCVVCEECARKANRAACACCHSWVEFSHESYYDAKRKAKELETRVSSLSHGNKTLHLPDSAIVCDMCSNKIIRDAIKCDIAALERKYGLSEKQPILLFQEVHADGAHCERCGAEVPESENYADLLKRWYSDEMYPYLYYKDECKSVIAKYLNAKSMCASCCWQIRPAHVRDDYMYRATKGWIAGVASDAHGDDFIVIHKFDTISLEALTDESTTLRDKSLLVGANSFVGLSKGFKDEGIFGHYVVSATPVLVKRKDNVHGSKSIRLSKTVQSCAASFELPKNIIIDGSNIIRFKDGGSVKGLATSISALNEKGCHVRVFLDANILHVLEDNGDAVGKALLEKLLSESSDTIKMVPAGSVADEFILLCANRDGSHILSNDRYEPYVKQYPWLKEKRSHKFMFMEGRLMIPDFGIDVEVQ